MAKKKLTFDEIMELADQYGVKENILFISAARRYAGQLDLIEKLQNDIQTIGLTIEKTNTNGAKNIDANPLVSQLPKYNDTANKTLSAMLEIISKLGTPAPAGDKLGEFLSE